VTDPFGVVCTGGVRSWVEMTRVLDEDGSYLGGEGAETARIRGENGSRDGQLCSNQPWGVTVNRRCGVEWMSLVVDERTKRVVDEERGQGVVGLNGVRAGKVVFEPTRRAKPANEMVKPQ
jgi:hypothetical protein